MPKEIYNSLNIWDETKSNYSNSTTLAKDIQRVNGFQQNEYLKSATFNGILLEMSLVTKSFISALAAVQTGSDRTGSITVNNSLSATDLTDAIKSVLEDLLVDKATNIAGGSAGSLLYQRDGGLTDFVAAGTTGQLLCYNNQTSKPEWKTPSDLTVGKATNIKGGQAGYIPVQSAADTTVLTNPSNITVGNATNATKINNKSFSMSYNSATGVLSITYV